ncbi:snare associated Golgi protein-domain-containing protein [Rhodofomes roseus]|uniref:Snare associated Golgi protein-domain-containing protein n=1 Tax=Rhodofomes roseus TaxID=34475 RepID=A0A4Y9Y4L7_9APHY|nr:snare associated Golgi protein-domain-containing protein [Rhodofomes roseus]KAH9844259.1 snare associated Golgi protein-domain-containing protein [Rhodofomes roseus]TFY56361.1 hypothetical protein EVJ58_g7690 [Rhodofomes roseus]
MASLLPPPNRHRASSTNVRPPLTLSSLGSRRRSNSLLDLPPHTPVHATPLTPPAEVDTPRPMVTLPVSPAKEVQDSPFESFVSRCLQLLHLTHDDTDLSAPSSPRHSRASTDSTILPMSASPTKETFAEAFPDDPTFQSRKWFLRGPPSVHTPVLFVLMLFPLSAALVVFCMSTLPITMQWPRNLTDLAELGRELQGYTQSEPAAMVHVLAVISITAVWKHAWSIPGSVIWNVLAGALISPAYATILFTMLTTIGSICASLLAAPLAPVLSQVFPRALDMTRSVLEGDSSSSDSASTKHSQAWVRLSILRLVGVVPWAGINIACGVCGVAIWDCFLGSFLGSLPWTAVTCQIGDILQTVASNPSPTQQSVRDLLTSPQIIFKLVFLSVLSLAPILGRNRLREWIATSVTSSPSALRGADQREERTSRWAWVRDWQSKIRVPSRSRTREVFRKELEALVQEKNASLPL